MRQASKGDLFCVLRSDRFPLKIGATRREYGGIRRKETDVLHQKRVLFSRLFPTSVKEREHYTMDKTYTIYNDQGDQIDVTLAELHAVFDLAEEFEWEPDADYRTGGNLTILPSQASTIATSLEQALWVPEAEDWSDRWHDVVNAVITVVRQSSDGGMFVRQIVTM